MFSKDLCCRHVKIRLVWERVKDLPNYKKVVSISAFSVAFITNFEDESYNLKIFIRPDVLKETFLLSVLDYSKNLEIDTTFNQPNYFFFFLNLKLAQTLIGYII